MIYWMLFSIACGIAEARIFSQVTWARKTNSFFDEHFFLTIVRAISWWVMCDGVLLLSGMMVFPFLHDGAYYEAYKRFLPGQYPKGWMDQSRTTDAIISLPFEIRLVWMIAGAAIWLTNSTL
jgi:hypothetical protein